jgi:hypothetical protein
MSSVKCPSGGRAPLYMHPQVQRAECPTSHRLFERSELKRAPMGDLRLPSHEMGPKAYGSAGK